MNEAPPPDQETQNKANLQLSDLEATIVLNRCDAPIRYGFSWFQAHDLLPEIDADETAIAEALASLQKRGLIQSEVVTNLDGPALRTTQEGQKARERLLRERKRRHPSLINQKAHDLQDLVLALVASGPTDTRLVSSPFVAPQPVRAVWEMELYLGEYSREQIYKACESLVARGFIAPATGVPTAGDKVLVFEATNKGRRAYKQDVAPRLKVLDGRSILELEERDRVEIFNAWQSDLDESRLAIRSALSDVVAAVNRDREPIRPLEVVEATLPGDGAIRIDAALLQRIKRADFFVADVTPVHAAGARLFVNQNVLVEVGYALASMEPEQVLLLAMDTEQTRAWVRAGGTWAFDIAHVQRHHFVDGAQLRLKLETELLAALSDRGFLPPKRS